MMTTTLDATVKRVNGRGFTVAERDGWLNLSRYADPADVPLPVAGQRVMLSLDGQGFVRRITPAGASAAGSAPSDQPAPARGRAGRDAIITRLAVLNTATSILSAGSQPVDPAAVLALAARLEHWAMQAGDEATVF